MNIIAPTQVKTTPKPTAIGIIPENIPAELKKLKQWVNWRYELVKDKWTKTPINSRTLGYAKSNDPSTWVTYAAAITQYNEQSNLNGIGIVPCKADPYCFIDIDHCLDEKKKITKDVVKEIVDNMNSYTEMTPSGEGLRIIFKAKTKKGRKRHNLEIYSDKHYLTITGNHYCGPATIEDRQKEADDFIDIYFDDEEEATVIDHSQYQCQPITNRRLNDAYERAILRPYGEHFRALFCGNWAAYESQSSADLALVSYMAYELGPDEDAIDGWFRQSGLYREKWNRQDYRCNTIQKVLDNLTKWHAMKSNVDVGHQLPINRDKTMYSLQELWQLPEPTFVVNEHIPENSLSVVCGSPGSFKSFWALDLALCVATGLPFLDKYDVQQGKVLYMCGEGFFGYKGRTRAWSKEKNADQCPEDFIMRRGRVDLCCPKRTGVITVMEECLKSHINEPKLIVIDTKSRFFTGNENDGEDTGRFIEAVDIIKEKTGAAVLIVDHTPKYNPKIIRGHGGMGGAADVVFNLLREDKEPLVKISNTKMKDCEELADYCLRSQSVVVFPDHPVPKMRSSLILHTTDEKSYSKEDKERMRSVYLTFKNGDTIEKAYERWGGSQSIKTFRGVVDMLIERGSIAVLEPHAGTRPATYSRL